MNKVTNTDKSKQRRAAGVWISENSVFVVFIIMLIICTLLSNNFLSWQNIANLFKQNSAIGIIAMGMLVVIMTGGIDLSIGAICGVCNVMMAYFLQEMKLSLGSSIALAILIGAVLGTINGVFIAYRKIPPFIVTLAMMSVASGFAYVVSRGSPIIVKNTGIEALGQGTLFYIPSLLWIFIVVFLVVMIVLKYSSYGRILKAIGSNKEATRLAGICTDKYIMSVYTIIGIAGAIAGVLAVARTGVGSPLIGNGYELNAITIVVIGGASLKGGKGTALHTLIGVFVIGIISNIMNLVNLSTYYQNIAMGLIILGAVFFRKDK